jgi:uncharacterized protein YjiS (DUF1127 family)
MMWQMAIQDLVCGHGVWCWLAFARGSAAARAAVAGWRRRVAERQELLALDGRMRRDAGIGPCELHAALRKPLWRA